MSKTRTLPPVWLSEYSDRDAAIIAGYLLREREGTLLALDQTAHNQSATDPMLGDLGHDYYKHAEAYSRLLLWRIGYDVEKGQENWDFVTGRSRYHGT